MINSCCKCNLRWFEGVVCRKMNCQKEYTTLIWAVIRSHNCGLPMKHIIPNWTCRTLCWRVTGQITKFLINPFQRHSLCFSSGSSLSRCVLKGPAKTLDYPGSWEGLSLRLTPVLPDTGAFCKNGADQHSHRPRRDPDESKSLKNGRGSGVGGVAKPPTASMPRFGPNRGRG
uniref:Ubiquitin-conjugating enzyme E2 D2 n=1 Tax=Sus scrofa TaxID=9823 RepID=A0A480I1I2_PIG